MAKKPPLRDRIREAGGFYKYWNSRLIRIAGPATVGPYETTPIEPSRAKPCPLCGAAMSEHTFERSTTAATRMACPR